MLSSLSQGLAAATVLDQTISHYRIEHLYPPLDQRCKYVHEFLSSQLPVFNRYTRIFGVFTAITGARVPATVLLSGFRGLDDMTSTDALMERDLGYRSACDHLQEKLGNYERAITLLRSPDGGLENIAQHNRAKEPRIFELRTYHSGTKQQLLDLYQVLSRPEGVFARSGLYPVVSAETVIGPKMPNLIYLIPFSDLHQREKAWDAVSSDREWSKADLAALSPLSTEVALLRATPYSPIQ